MITRVQHIQPKKGGRRKRNKPTKIEDLYDNKKRRKTIDTPINTTSKSKRKAPKMESVEIRIDNFNTNNKD
jgi:hypothetical protein